MSIREAKNKFYIVCFGLNIILISYVCALTISNLFLNRFGFPEMVFEPSLVDTLEITLKSGNTVKTNNMHTLERIKITTDHLPGKFNVFFFTVFVLLLHFLYNIR